MTMAYILITVRMSTVRWPARMHMDTLYGFVCRIKLFRFDGIRQDIVESSMKGKRIITNKQKRTHNRLVKADLWHFSLKPFFFQPSH